MEAHIPLPQPMVTCAQVERRACYRCWPRHQPKHSAPRSAKRTPLRTSQGPIGGRYCQGLGAKSKHLLRQPRAGCFEGPGDCSAWRQPYREPGQTSVVHPHGPRWSEGPSRLSCSHSPSPAQRSCGRARCPPAPSPWPPDRPGGREEPLHRHRRPETSSAA